MIICKNENDNRLPALLPIVGASITASGDLKCDKKIEVAISQILENSQQKSEFSKGIPLVFIHKNRPHELTVIGSVTELKDRYAVSKIDNNKYQIIVNNVFKRNGCLYVVRCHMLPTNELPSGYMVFSLAPRLDDMKKPSDYNTMIDTIERYITSTSKDKDINIDSPELDPDDMDTLLSELSDVFNEIISRIE